MPTLSLAAPRLTPKQLEQVARHLIEDKATPFPPDAGAQLMVAGTPVHFRWGPRRYQGPREAELFGFWNSQDDADSFGAGPFAQALKAAGVPDNSPWFTIEINTLEQTIFTGKEYEFFDEPRPTLVLGLIEDQPREQFDKVMEHLPQPAALPSGAQLMLSASRPVAAGAPGWMTISIWNSEEGADQFCTDFIAASQAAGVPTTDKTQWHKSMIHTAIRQRRVVRTRGF